MSNLFDHFDDVHDWPCRWFSPKEIACRGTGQILINRAALLALDEFRSLMGRPITINSAYRSAYHNARVGGAPLSYHRRGVAFDVALKDMDKETIRRTAEQCGFRGFGMNYRTFVHIDTGPKRDW